MTSQDKMSMSLDDIIKQESSVGKGQVNSVTPRRGRGRGRGRGATSFQRRGNNRSQIMQVSRGQGRGRGGNRGRGQTFRSWNGQQSQGVQQQQRRGRSRGRFRSVSRARGNWLRSRSRSRTTGGSQDRSRSHSRPSGGPRGRSRSRGRTSSTGERARSRSRPPTGMERSRSRSRGRAFLSGSANQIRSLSRARGRSRSRSRPLSIRSRSRSRSNMRSMLPLPLSRARSRTQAPPRLVLFRPAGRVPPYPQRSQLRLIRNRVRRAARFLVSLGRTTGGLAHVSPGRDNEWKMAGTFRSDYITRTHQNYQQGAHDNNTDLFFVPDGMYGNQLLVNIQNEYAVQPRSGGRTWPRGRGGRRSQFIGTPGRHSQDVMEANEMMEISQTHQSPVRQTVALRGSAGGAGDATHASLNDTNSTLNRKVADGQNTHLVPTLVVEKNVVESIAQPTACATRMTLSERFSK